MIKPKFVTFTGADDKTSVESLNNFYSCQPFAHYNRVEFGILFSQKRAGQRRYPSIDWIYNMLVNGKFNFAIHLCGDTVYDWLDGNPALLRLFKKAPRIQLNFNHSKRPIDPNRLKFLRCNKDYEGDIILQDNSNNSTLINSYNLWNWRGIYLLKDESGGNGITPLGWTKPNLKYFYEYENALFGYAGGLGTDNIKEEIVKISDILEKEEQLNYPVRSWTRNWNYYIDMETKLRNDKDEFDLDICKDIIKAVYKS